MWNTGTGGFGRVKLVRHKETGAFLALKMLRKSEIVRMHQAVHVCAERSILAELNHPYIIRLCALPSIRVCLQSRCTPVDVSRLSDGLEGVVNNRRTGLDAAENHIDIVDSSSRYGAQVLADREPSPTPQPHRHATYQDTHHVYMLLDFVPGGDFFSHLRLARRFSPATVKHYVGCIILALDYVHSRGVVYRDLKPENLLLDIKGRIKLTDFGLAKKVTDR